MDPVTMALMGASLAGGILSGAGGKKTISPEWLKQHFGADAVNEEMISLFNNVLNSPYGQQLMTNAASQGSQFENALRSGTAASGLSGGEGGSSGASIFSDAAAGGATKSLTNQAKSGIFQQVLPVAQSMVQSRLAAYMGQPAMSEPTAMAKFGASLGSLGAAGLSATNFGQNAPATPQAINAPAGGSTMANMGERGRGAMAMSGGEGTTGVSRLATPNTFVNERMRSMFNTNAVQPSRFRASVGGSF